MSRAAVRCEQHREPSCDFEPAMAGAAEYEFASAGLFVTRGDREALRSLLHA